MRVDRNGDVRRRDHVDHLGGIDIVVCRHCSTVARRHPALKSFPHGLEREVFQAARVGIIGIVHKHVDVAIMLLGKVEADVDVGARVLVGVLVPGQAADNIAAFLERLFQELGGAGIAHDAFLGEGDDLDVADMLVLLARQHEAARRTQSADRSHVRKEAEECRSVAYPCLDHAAGALRDLLRIVLAFELVRYLDRFRQGSRHIGAHDLAEERFIRVQVQIDEARDDRYLPSVDGVRRARRAIGADGDNPPARDGNIDQRLVLPQPRVTDDEVGHIRSKM